MVPSIVFIVMMLGAVIIVCPLCSTYEWQDSKNKKHVKLPAKQYIDSALSNIQKQLCEEAIFPTKFGMWINCSVYNNSTCVKYITS